MTTGKTIALTRRTFVGKVMSLLLNMLSRLVITFLPRSKHLLISWLQSPSAVILEPRKIKSDTISTVFPSISHTKMIFWYFEEELSLYIRNSCDVQIKLLSHKDFLKDTEIHFLSITLLPFFFGYPKGWIITKIWTKISCNSRAMQESSV